MNRYHIKAWLREAGSNARYEQTSVILSAESDHDALEKNKEQQEKAGFEVFVQHCLGVMH